MTNNNAMPKAMPIAEISHILARIGILRSLHASAVANRFKLNPTEVKIMGYVKSNTLKRGVSDILDCYNIGESSAARSISRLESETHGFSGFRGGDLYCELYFGRTEKICQ